MMYEFELKVKEHNFLPNFLKWHWKKKKKKEKKKKKKSVGSSLSTGLFS